MLSQLQLRNLALASARVSGTNKFTYLVQIRQAAVIIQRNSLVQDCLTESVPARCQAYVHCHSSYQSSRRGSMQ